MPLFRLSDDTPVAVRQIQPTDKRLIAAARSRFSDETMYRRFLSPKPRLSNAELRYLTEVDGRDHVAFVAVHADRPWELLGVGRFVRLRTDPAAADVAIIVADEHQGKGLGKRLSLILGDAARERGIERFVASMLSDSPAAHRLMHALTDRLEDHGHQQGVHELVADLAA